jgi:hypothetical protein
VNLSVSATGENLSYQWQYRRSSSDSWADVSNSDMSSFPTGAQSEQLTLRNINERINNVIYNYFGYYRVVVSNSGGSVSAEVSVWEQSDPNAPPPPPPSDSDGDGIADNEDQFPYDYDNDGINDIYETNTGTYVSATNTGTDPNVSDTDADGIGDGYETNTGTFLSSSDTGTNPNIYDTDGDGINDLVDYAPNNFAIKAPSLSISRSGDDIIITWPNNTGFELKHSTDLSSWFSTGVSQGSYTETMDSAKFFMLSKN